MVGGFGATVAWFVTRPYPCRATFEQVRVGMTRDEVYSTVGGPPGVYGVPNTYRYKDVLCIHTWQAPDQGLAEDSLLMVSFADGGRVETATVLKAVTYQNAPPLLRRIRSWLGL